MQCWSWRSGRSAARCRGGCRRLSDWYLRVADESLTGISARCRGGALAILPATMLMGATLPAVARWVKSTPEGLRAARRLLRGEYDRGSDRLPWRPVSCLLPQTDAMFTSHVAAAINVLVGVSGVAAGIVTSLFATGCLRRWTRHSATRRRSSCRDRPVRLRGAGGRGGLDAAACRCCSARPSTRSPSSSRCFSTGWESAARWRPAGSTRSSRPLRWLAIAQLAIVCLGPVREFRHHARRALLGAAGGRRNAGCLRDLRPRHAASGGRRAARGVALGREFSARAGRGGTRADGTPAGWSARSMPPTRWGRSSARSSPAPCWCRGSARSTHSRCSCSCPGWRRHWRLRDAGVPVDAARGCTSRGHLRRSRSRSSPRCWSSCRRTDCSVGRCIRTGGPTTYDHVFQREGRTADSRRPATRTVRTSASSASAARSRRRTTRPTSAASGCSDICRRSCTAAPKKDADRRLGHRHHGRLLRRPSRGREHHDLRDRACGERGGGSLLRRREQSRARRSADDDPLRRRPPLPGHHRREVRRHHLRPDQLVDPRHGGALLDRVFRSLQTASQPGRRGRAMDSALREGPGHGEVRAGDLSRGISQRDAVDELARRATGPTCGTTSSPSASSNRRRSISPGSIAASTRTTSSKRSSTK